MTITDPPGPSRRAALAAAGLLLAAGALAACGTNASQNSDARACTDLPGTNIPASAIGLPTKGGLVGAAKLVPAKGTGAAATAEFCQVDATLHPVDPSASAIKVRVALPTNWNGKAWQFGGGGYDGTVKPVDNYASMVGGQSLLTRGYATFSSDGGHEGNNSLDASFALKGNDEELRNYVGDALKKTRDAAMFLMQAHYGKVPERPYFVGGSNGGRQALRIAHTWPTDYAGVVSMAPGDVGGALELGMLNLIKVFAQPGAWPNPAKQKLLYNEVVNACDGDDGVRDGLIANPDGCHFDPHVLRCPNGTDTGDTCLSDAQVEAVIAASAPVKFNVPLSSGETGYPGFPLLSGMELRTPELGIGTKPPTNSMTASDTQLYGHSNGFTLYFPTNWVRNFVTKDPNYPVLDFDPAQWQQRINDLNKMQGYNNPDLSAFAKAGGKLLLMHGTSDEIISYRATADYFNRMRDIVGSAATHDFARFYLIPGLDHWGKIQAFDQGWDFATALDNWVQHGQPPQNPVATDLRPDGANRTRPMCEYPAWPKYNGTGDVNQASSFTCVGQP